MQLATALVRSLPPQGTGRLTVTLEPEDGIRVTGSRIQITYPHGRTANFPVNEEGRLSLELVPGSYKLKFGSKGWFEGGLQSPEVSAIANKDQSAEVTLPIYAPRQVEIEWLF